MKCVETNSNFVSKTDGDLLAAMKDWTETEFHRPWSRIGLAASAGSRDSFTLVSKSDMYGLDVGVFVKCEEAKEEKKEKEKKKVIYV